MKSISDRDIIAHKPVTDVATIDFDHNKRRKKIPKNRTPLQDASCTRRSTLALRLFLQEFCVEFLNGAYNNIMNIVKDNLDRSKTQEHDESYYMWAIKFFMEFNRHHEFKLELVTETLSIETVHYIQTNIQNYHDMMTTEKKKIPLWSRRMHNGLRAYHELLMTLAVMDKSDDSSVRNSSLALKSKMFYVVEYRELPLILLLNYDQIKMSKGYLKDLVEMSHIFLKLLEGMCMKTRHLMVQQPKKNKSTKKKKARPNKESIVSPTTEQLEELWTTATDELSVVMQGSAAELPTVVPYDSLSELSEDQQKEVSMRKIHAHLRKKEFPEAVSLFRASRELWPEGDIFGPQEGDISEELGCFREIFMADLNPIEEPQGPVSEPEEDDENELVQEMEQSRAHISEKELDFPAFIRRFAHVKVIQAYTLLLKNYLTNSPLTNRCLIKLFHRIAWDCKMPAIFFQSSILIILYQTMTDPTRKSNEIIGEIDKFAKYIVRQLFKVAETNPKVFIEILFWKTQREALEVECGYDAPADSKALKNVWTEEEEDEIIRLYEEFKDHQHDPEDSRDIADVIVQNLIRQDRTRRIVIMKLKDLGLIQHVKQLANKSVKVNLRQWTETEEDELKVLFEEHKDAMDTISRIMDFMITPKSKPRIIAKLIELGCIKDKSEVKKKRVSKPKQPKGNKSKSTGQNFLVANDCSDNDDEVQSSNSDDSGDSDDDPSSIASNGKAKRRAAPAVVTPYLISSALAKVMADDRKNAVEWLVEILTEIADDREQDGEFEDIPILAINTEQTEAIENYKFQTMMKIIGLQAPQSHEEMFWRVPAKLTIEGLRKRAEYLTQGLQGTLTVAMEEVNAHSETVVSSDDSRSSTPEGRSNESHGTEKTQQLDDDKENRSENVNDIVGVDNSKSINMFLNKSEPFASHNTTKPTSKRQHSDDFDSLLPSSAANKKRRVIIQDSDDEGELPQTNTENIQLRLESSELTEEMDVSQNNSTSRMRIVDSDDDSDENLEDINASIKGQTSSVGRMFSSDDEHENVTCRTALSQSRRLIESDEEEVVVPAVRSKSKTVIDSDED